MVYEVNPAGRADPVPGGEADPEDESAHAAAVRTITGLVSLEDMTVPWAKGDRREKDSAR